MLADQLDYVIGVDPHRDVHAFAVVEVRTGGVVFEARSPRPVSVTSGRSSSLAATLRGGARLLWRGAARSGRA